MSIIIQNGEAAGQTVAHVHAHLIPYQSIKKNMHNTRKSGKRRRRSLEDMAKEAEELKLKLG